MLNEEKEKEKKVPTKALSKRSPLVCSWQNSAILANMREFYGISSLHNHARGRLELMRQLSTGIYVLPVSGKIMSLRLIDWFVTNFAKKHFVVHIYRNALGQPTRFNVYEEYKLQLKSYSKKRFDPFCRWYHVNIPYDSNQTISTTLGQLQFFKWVMEHELTTYIDAHVDAIVADMNAHSTASRRKHAMDKTRKKREELSASATKCIKFEQVEMEELIFA